MNTAHGFKKGAFDYFKRVSASENLGILFSQLCRENIPMTLELITKRLNELKALRQIPAFLDTNSQDWDKRMAQLIVTRWQSERQCPVG